MTKANGKKNNQIVTTTGMTQSEFGAALLTEARNRKQKVLLEKSIAEAQTVLSSIEECDRKIDYFKGWKETREAQLEALENGEFTLDPSGNVVYNTAALNRK